VRGKRYHPSEYLSLPGCAALIRSAPGVGAARMATNVYFANSYREAWRELAGTRLPLKRRAVRAVLARARTVCARFGASAD
jgi:hypothetical protein